MPYLVFLPPGYDSDRAARFPALYMLHGLGGDLTEWTEYRIFEEADALIRAGEIPPLLIVLPEGGQSYWVDTPAAPAGGRTRPATSPPRSTAATAPWPTLTTAPSAATRWAPTPPSSSP